MQGSVAEWSKALVLGTSLFGGVSLNPTSVIVSLEKKCFKIGMKIYNVYIYANHIC